MSFPVRSSKLAGNIKDCVRGFYAPQIRSVHNSSSVMNDRKNRSEGRETDCLRIGGLPRSATPGDILRLTKQIVKADGGLENIAEVKLDYHRFIPTGRAVIRMTDSRFVDVAVRTLRTAQMSTLPLRAWKAEVRSAVRTRGVRGRAEAAERAVIEGNGPGGGIFPKGCDVVLSGLPEQVQSAALKGFLRRAGLVEAARDGRPDCEVLNVEVFRRWQSATSKHLIRLRTPSQAHALVRRLHMTYYIPEDWGTRYLMKARLVY